MPTMTPGQFSMSVFGNSPSMSIRKWSIGFTAPSATFAGTVTSDDPQGCSVVASSIVYTGTRYFANEQTQNTLMYSGYDVILLINYPAEIDDLQGMVGMQVKVEFNDSSGNYYAQNTLDFGRPSIGNVLGYSGFGSVEPSSKPYSVDEHQVSWPSGTWADCADCDVVSIEFDFGDGTVEEKSLTSRRDTYKWLGDLNSPVTHTFTPDEYGDGTGVPITIRVKDVWGRKSAINQLNIKPQAALDMNVDESTGDFIFDSSPSYGRTGKLVSRELVVAGSFGAIIPADLALDIQGRKFRIKAQVNGAINYEFRLNDGAGTLTVNSPLKTPTQFLYPKTIIEHPPNDAVCLVGGSIIEAIESGGYNASQTILRKKVKGYNSPIPNNGSANSNQFHPWFFANVADLTRPNLPNTSCPRLAQRDNIIFLAAKHRDGITKLYRSEDDARMWEELSMIWTPDYYHHSFILLTGGGAASAALKRHDSGSKTSSGLALYQAEIWFKKTHDLENWDADPVKVWTYPEVNGVVLADTITFYPTLLSESQVGGSNRLLIELSPYQRFFESIDTGATWRLVGN